MYRGVAGAEVGALIRRLQSRLGIAREQMRCILTSASLGYGIGCGRSRKSICRRANQQAKESSVCDCSWNQGSPRWFTPWNSRRGFGVCAN